MVLALFVSSIHAQKTRTKGKGKTEKTTHAVQVETPGQKLYKSMLQSTAKIMFVDSVVVPKSVFLSRIPLGESAGKLSISTNVTAAQQMGQYENDFGDRRFFAQGDTTQVALYTQTLLGNGWSAPTKLAEIDDKIYTMQNFPFLCTDGVTLFFAAQGENSMGGYDIFMTSFNTDEGKWYEPQNYGLPFNSTANDYLLALDDQNELGWLVSDRRQNVDSVCIYTFVPTTPRQDFTNDDIDQRQLEHYANISAISDTWRFGNREDAMKRLQNTKDGQKDVVGLYKQSPLVINDIRIAYNINDLSVAESRMLYKQWLELNEMLTETRIAIDLQRKAIANGAAVNGQLRQQVLQLEHNMMQQQRDIKEIEKKIRLLESQ